MKLLNFEELVVPANHFYERDKQYIYILGIFSNI